MKNKVSKVIVISFFIVLLYLMLVDRFKEHSIDKYGKITIGKYVERDNWGKYRSNYFIYCKSNKKYKGNGRTSPVGFSVNIGKFYKIKYLDKYPEVIHPIYDQEVTDTTEILKAGFSKEDL